MEPQVISDARASKRRIKIKSKLLEAPKFLLRLEEVPPRKVVKHLCQVLKGSQILERSMDAKPASKEKMCIAHKRLDRHAGRGCDHL